VTGSRCRESTDSSISDVAPVGAAVSHVCHTVSSSVDNELRIEADCAHLLLKELDIVQLCVGSIPFSRQIAWVLAARLILIIVVKAVIISVIISFLPWAHLTDWLVVCNVSREAAKFLVRQIVDDVDECGHVV